MGESQIENWKSRDDEWSKDEMHPAADSAGELESRHGNVVVPNDARDEEPAVTYKS